MFETGYFVDHVDADGFAVGDFWISEPLPGGWVAAYHFATQKGSPVLTSLRVLAPAQVEALRAAGRPLGSRHVDDVRGNDVPAGGLSSRALRSLRPKTALRKVIAEQLPAWDELTAKLLHIAGDDEARDVEPRSVDERLAQVAELYTSLVTGSPNVNVAIAKKLERPVSHIRDDVYAARLKGFLTEGGGHGRSGGQLTEKGRQVLRRMRDDAAR